MKSLTRNFGKLLLAGTIAFMTSCNKDDDNSSQNNNSNVVEKDETVKGVLEDESKYSSMNEAVEESDQSGFFTNTSANITLFAANNDAWNEFFAEMNVNSMTELKSKMGEDNFSKMVLYLAVNGKFKASDFSEGFHETSAESDNGSRLHLYIENKGNGMLYLNGNDENGAATVGNTTISATNGAVIEVNSVLRGQTTYENMEEGNNEESSYYLNLMANANADIRARLQNENQESTVFLGEEDEVKSMLRINLTSIFDENDLDAMLTLSQKTTLLANLGGSDWSDIWSGLTLQSLLDVGLNLDEMMSGMDSESRSRLVSGFIVEGNYDKDDLMNSGSFTTESGITFDVSSNSEGNIVLTDEDGDEIILDSESTQSINGSVYTVLEVRNN